MKKSEEKIRHFLSMGTRVIIIKYIFFRQLLNRQKHIYSYQILYIILYVTYHGRPRFSQRSRLNVRTNINTRTTANRMIPRRKNRLIFSEFGFPKEFSHTRIGTE